MTPSMTEDEAREILQNVPVEDWKPLHHAAHGFLAGLSQERARAERLVESIEKSKQYIMQQTEFGQRIPELYYEVSSALSAYNQEKGETEVKP